MFLMQEYNLSFACEIYIINYYKCVEKKRTIIRRYEKFLS